MATPTHNAKLFYALPDGSWKMIEGCINISTPSSQEEQEGEDNRLSSSWREHSWGQAYIPPIQGGFSARDLAKRQRGKLWLEAMKRASVRRRR